MPTGALDFVSYQQLVVHPHVGQLLLSQLTNYPARRWRAPMAEHHERLDGSGYPHALQARRVSPLGRLLAVTEGGAGGVMRVRPALTWRAPVWRCASCPANST
jgi:HD-GYP domain-containing protein (c-di-GMP phosphodiesterase class II)